MTPPGDVRRVAVDAGELHGERVDERHVTVERHRKTGWSGRTSSISWCVGSAAGVQVRSWSHSPPRSQRPCAAASAKSRDAAAEFRLAWRRPPAAPRRARRRRRGDGRGVVEAGHDAAALQVDDLAYPARRACARRRMVPTATMRSAPMATASASGCSGFSVQTLPLTRMRSQATPARQPSRAPRAARPNDTNRCACFPLSAGCGQDSRWPGPS